MPKRKESHESSWLRVATGLLIAAALFSALFAKMFGIGRWRDHRIAEGYEKIEIGWSREKVERLLGAPDVTGPCGRFFRDPPKPECHEELIYEPSQTPAIPLYWLIAFDGDGRVDSKENRPSMHGGRPRDSAGIAHPIR